MRHVMSSGSTFERDVGYSRAVVDGDWVFVSGTTGFDVREQAEQALRTIEHVLGEAGSSMQHVARVRYILPDLADFESCWPVFKRYFGVARPAATVFGARLLDPRMKIEIEVTARRGPMARPSP